MVDLLKGPIPGQSLTDTPKNSPWEKPSELNEVEEVVEFYIKQISNDEAMDDLAVLFELGGDLKTTTEVLCLSGTMKGMHTVETGMLAAPVISAYLKLAMEMYGVDAKDDNVDYEKTASEKEKQRLKLLMDRAAEMAKDGEEDDAGIELLNSMQQVLNENPEAEEEPPVDIPPADTPPEEDIEQMAMPEPGTAPMSDRGLMSRGVI